MAIPGLAVQTLAPSLALPWDLSHHLIYTSYQRPELKHKNAWQRYHAVILASVAGRFLGSLKCRDHRKRAVCMGSSGTTELLVDGDCHSIDGIKQAIMCLEAHCGHAVTTTLFAPPERRHNKKWQQFLDEGGISFRPVQRGSSQMLAEPNDKVIINAMKQLSKKPKVRLALLTEDSDFIDPMLALQAQGTNVVVLIPENLFFTIRKYENQGLKVLTVTLPGKPGTRVRAILHEDCNGSVKLAEPFEPFADEVYIPAGDYVEERLQDLGYGETGQGFINKKCVKFWVQNQLGSVTVFPIQHLVMAVHHALTASDVAGKWQRASEDLAVFLPITSRGRRLQKKEEDTYGYVRARGIFKGGGPFILEDSSELVVRALDRLGFLDEGLNTDVPEALFLFINATENKKPLRKNGFLPSPEQNHVDVEKKLRKAFLSNALPSTWQVASKSSNLMSNVVNVLQTAKIISQPGETQYSTEEIFHAMKLFAKQHHLFGMRTFNGLAWMILRHNQTGGTKRPVVEFRR